MKIPKFIAVHKVIYCLLCSDKIYNFYIYDFYDFFLFEKQKGSQVVNVRLVTSKVLVGCVKVDELFGRSSQ